MESSAEFNLRIAVLVAAQYVMKPWLEVETNDMIFLLGNNDVTSSCKTLISISPPVFPPSMALFHNNAAAE